MKIGIVTVADSANFGSFLQGFALQEVLKKMGHEVEFLETREAGYIRSLYFRWRPGRTDIKHPIRFVRRNINGHKKYKMFKMDQEKIVICSCENKDEFDCVILGSDEIWNVCTKVFRQPIFYGKDMKKVFAYAVSSGKATYEEFERYPDIMKQICQIEDVFVRDKKTQSIVKEITGKCPELVCDPTMLVERSLFFGGDSIAFKNQKKYILIYMYPQFVNCKDVRVIKEFARSMNLALISVGFHNEWCDNNIMCGPMEFCSVIQHAELVVTATFHGSVFSILNEKQFVSVGLTDKVKDLLERLGLEQQLVTQQKITNEILKEKLIDNEVDYDAVNTRIAVWKEKSLEKLEEVITKYANRNM